MKRRAGISEYSRHFQRAPSWQSRARPTTFGPLASGVLAAVLVATNAQPTLAQQHTLDDWMTVSSVSSFEWSPDGRFFYYTSNAASSGTADIFRIPTTGGDPVRLGQDVPGVRPEPKQELTLSPDGETLYFTAARYFQAYLNIFRMPAAGGPAQAITFNDAVIQTGPTISADGQTLAFFGRNGRGAKIYTLDLRDDGAWPRMLFPEGGEETAPSWSPDGSLAFRRGGDIWVQRAGQAEPHRIVEAAYGGGNGGNVWSPTGDRMAFTKGQSGFAQVGVVDVATGEVTPITQEPNEHSAVAWSPDGSWLAYVRNDDGGMSSDVVVTSADGSGEPRALTKGKGWRSAPRFSPDGTRVAFIESTSVRTGDIWVADIADGRVTQVTHSMGRVDPDALIDAQEVSYRAEDNLEVPAMLWLPPDFDANRRYPVLVRLHGHPGQWNHGFRMMTQYFVSRGFVAIAPNPRGSRGFGQGFHDLHIGDYGGAEFRDVMSVLPFLESLGYVDMDRKATWGGSGGGYMNLVIATEAPDAFEAQVIRAPVSDWQLLAIDRFGASGRAWTATRTPRRERSEFGGSYDEIPEEYERRSPVNFVESVTVPQLLFQGLRDTSVPPRQSTVWVDRMRELGKSDLIDYVEYADEDHGLRRYKTTVRDRIERMTRFFAEHLNLPDLSVY